VRTSPGLSTNDWWRPGAKAILRRGTRDAAGTARSNRPAQPRAVCLFFGPRAARGRKPPRLFSLNHSPRCSHFIFYADANQKVPVTSECAGAHSSPSSSPWFEHAPMSPQILFRSRFRERPIQTIRGRRCSAEGAKDRVCERRFHTRRRRRLTQRARTGMGHRPASPAMRESGAGGPTPAWPGNPPRTGSRWSGAGQRRASNGQQAEPAGPRSSPTPPALGYRIPAKWPVASSTRSKTGGAQPLATFSGRSPLKKWRCGAPKGTERRRQCQAAARPRHSATPLAC